MENKPTQNRYERTNWMLNLMIKMTIKTLLDREDDDENVSLNFQVLGEETIMDRKEKKR